MRRLLFTTLCVYFMFLPSAFGCDCGPRPVASHVEGASIVFVGKVVFTDEDGTGSNHQKTLVHFQIEESFKGLAPETHDVWVDPGSFTDCYFNYALGTRYIVFAYHDGWPQEQSHIASRKPVPAGIDSKNPPTVYWGPECSGTEPITSKTKRSISREVVYLRKYKKESQESPTP
jgi:hypothetical protein